MKKNMKKFLYALSFFALKALSDEIPLGEEKIYPLEFSKSYVAYDLNIIDKNIYGLNGSNISKKIKASLKTNYQLAFEMGLNKYFNAGGTFQVEEVSDSFLVGASLFLKPHFKITDKWAIFSKFRAGLLHSGGMMEIDPSKFDTVYNGSSYYPAGFGFPLGASAGIDFFPWSRIGLFAEWGLKSSFIFFLKDRSNNIGNGPKVMSYVINNFPITTGIYIIF